jgi:hypothetical protein
MCGTSLCPARPAVIEHVADVSGHRRAIAAVRRLAGTGLVSRSAMGFANSLTKA